MKDIYVDKSFFGTGGVSTSAGLTDYHFTDSEIRKIMIKNSNVSFVLFDESKIGTITISKFADFSEVNTFISYNVTNKKFLQFVADEKVHFIDAKESLNRISKE